jgi:hypothetical protein
MKVIIAGSRDLDLNQWSDKEELIEFAIKRSGFDITQVITGCARGIDRVGAGLGAYLYGDDNVIGFPADWTKHGKSAGFIRNVEMAKEADALILIWNGRSSGSAHMKSEMVKLGKPIYEIIENKSNNAEEHKFRM